MYHCFFSVDDDDDDAADDDAVDEAAASHELDETEDEEEEERMRRSSTSAISFVPECALRTAKSSSEVGSDALVPHSDPSAFSLSVIASM